MEAATHSTSTSEPMAAASSDPSHSSIRDSSPAISTFTIFAIAFPSVDG
jgi:hypothetical protein